MKYRSRAEIVATLLRAGVRGASKTKLMYGAMLSYEQLQAYLKFTQEKGLIAQDGEFPRYRTTARGMRFLERYAKIGHLLTPDEKTVQLPKAPEKPTVPKPSPAPNAQ
jgi:predicted transcriptional regulator